MIELYKWQKEFIELFLKKRKYIANIATGAGKTQAAIEIIKKLWEINPNYNILISTPTIVSLETLWLKQLQQNNITLNKVGVYYSFCHEFSKITLTTNKSVRKIPLEIFNIIIIDEVHWWNSKSFLDILRKNKFDYLLGLSASIYNKEQKHWKLLELFDYNIYKYDTREAIEDGIINTFNLTDVAVQIKEPEIIINYEKLEQDIKAALAKMGGFEKFIKLSNSNEDKMKLQKLFNNRNELILNYYRKLDVAADLIEKHKNEKILVFNQYNKISTKLTWHLIEKKIKSKIIDSHVGRDERLKIIKEYETGKFNVLLTSKVFDESYNLSDIQLIIIISGSSTERQMIQRIGRVLRKKDKPSEVYQIYIQNTFEEIHAKERSKDFKEVALNYKIEII
jgi:superfamily II DNA or RNA helicase